MTRIIFLNRYFYPDHSATSQILSDLTFALAADGRDVHVVTSRQRYDDATAELPEQEIIRGLRVTRVPTTRFGRASLLGRGLDYLSCYRAMAHAVDRLAGPRDLLVAMTDPPLLSVVAARAAKRTGARLINWLQDLYPEAAVMLDVPFMRGPTPRLLAFWRDKSLRSAAMNVVVSEAMAQRVAGRGISPDRIRTITNWTDDENIVSMPAAENPLRRAWGLDGKFVVGYSGNFGRAHDFDTVLAAAERLRGHPRIVFVFIGGGQQHDFLTRSVRDRGLAGTVRLFPYQDRSTLSVSLCVADVHWLSLRPALEGIIFPSKFYGIAAAGRPILALTSTGGEIAELLDHYCCGFVIEPRDVTRLADILTALAVDAEYCDDLGRRARAMLDAAFTRRQAFELWRRAIDQIT